MSEFDYNFERSDLRRSWLVIGAINHLDRPTVTSISHDLGFRKSSVQRVLERLNSKELPGFSISMDGVVISINSWGILNKKIIEEFYKKFLKVRS